MREPAIEADMSLEAGAPLLTLHGLTLRAGQRVLLQGLSMADRKSVV